MHIPAGTHLRRLSAVALLLGLAAPLTVIADDAAAPKMEATLDLQDGDTLVFLGDSITHQRLYTQYVETFFYNRFPDRHITFHNAGVGGAQAWDALQRIQKDVIDYKPKYVTILLGMNDGHYQPFDRATFDMYQKDMTEVLRLIKDAGAKPVLMSPTMFDARAAAKSKRPKELLAEYNSVLAYYGRWLQHTAMESGDAYVDMYGPLNELTRQQRQKDGGFTLINDSIHPDAPGQVVMALAIVEQLGFRKPLSSIVVRLGGKQGPRARSTGGEVTELTRTGDQITFDWMATGLPWVFPENAQPGADLTKAAARTSREIIRISGLPLGKYEVEIDGTVVGEWSEADLARHIELQSNEKTPQYQQARAVAELNREKNEGPVKTLRDDWLRFQMYKRLQQNLEKQPDNEKLKTQVADLTTQMEGLDERVAKANAEIDEFEAKIYAANKPAKRHFVIRKVK